jgi:hypothetical protein
MADFILQNSKLWVHKWHLSADHNELGLTKDVEPLEDSAFGDGARSFIGGLHIGELVGHGWWNGGTDQVDDALFQNLGIDDRLISVAPVAGVEGEVGYTMLTTQGLYVPDGRIGQIFSFNVRARSRGGPGLLRGIVMANGTIIATGNGTGFQLGAVASGQRIYAGLHVIGPTAGTSIAVVLESATANTFAGATTRITFTLATGPTAEFLSAVGPITDTWWRYRYVVAGGGPSFPIAGVAGIQ